MDDRRSQRLKVIHGHLGRNKFIAPTNVATAVYTDYKPQFQYSLDNPVLTLDQRRFYEDNGYLIVKKLVGDRYLDIYRERFIDLCTGAVKSPGVTIMKDVSFVKMGITGERAVNKVQDFIYDDVLSKYCHLPEVLDYVQCFTGHNVMAMHTMLISKPPDPGTLTSRHPLHQDLHYFPFRPANRIACSWTAMEKVNRDNGCLVALPGSHKGQLLKHGYPDWEGGVNKLYHGILGLSDNDIDARVFLEMEKGDTVFFHPLLIHGSGTNRTQGYRKAISCHYAASDCHYIDVKGTSQEIMVDEINDILKSKELQIDDISEVWMARGRLVRGERINL